MDLTYFVIPDGVITIKSFAFSSCYALATLVLPASITSLCDYAFAYNSNLTYIKYKGTKAQWAQISKFSSWANYIGTNVVTCSDGDASL